jgi:hypothetical protein
MLREISTKKSLQNGLKYQNSKHKRAHLIEHHYRSSIVESKNVNCVFCEISTSLNLRTEDRHSLVRSPKTLINSLKVQ